MSLFKRIIGTSEDDKIGLHKIHCVVSEISNDRLTVAHAVTILILNETETSDLIRLLTHLSTVPDKITSSARIFNYLCLGELGVKHGRDYTDESLFWEMVEAE